jgi:hypothetical protein
VTHSSGVAALFRSITSMSKALTGRRVDAQLCDGYDYAKRTMRRAAQSNAGRHET